MASTVTTSQTPLSGLGEDGGCIDVIRFGLHRALRKIRHRLSRAGPRSTAARARDNARLTVRCVMGSSPLGGRRRGVVTYGPAPV